MAEDKPELPTFLLPAVPPYSDEARKELVKKAKKYFNNGSEVDPRSIDGIVTDETTGERFIRVRRPNPLDPGNSVRVHVPLEPVKLTKPTPQQQPQE